VGAFETAVDFLLREDWRMCQHTTVAHPPANR
jgi:hypothetical protein